MFFLPRFVDFSSYGENSAGYELSDCDFKALAFSGLFIAYGLIDRLLLRLSSRSSSESSSGLPEGEEF